MSCVGITVSGGSITHNSLGATPGVNHGYFSCTAPTSTASLATATPTAVVCINGAASTPSNLAG
jgi:hypothetical protein